MMPPLQPEVKVTFRSLEARRIPAEPSKHHLLSFFQLINRTSLRCALVISQLRN